MHRNLAWNLDEKRCTYKKQEDPPMGSLGGTIAQQIRWLCAYLYTHPEWKLS